MKTVTVYMVAPGTPTTWYASGPDGGHSITGHMFIGADDSEDDMPPSYIGWAQADDDGDGIFTNPNGSGYVYRDDHLRYEEAQYAKTIVLTDEQYENLIEFMSDPQAAGWGDDYNLIGSNCVNFGWTALAAAGLTTGGYLGYGTLPIENARLLDRMFPDYPAVPRDDLDSPSWFLPPKTRMDYAPNMNSPLVLDLDGDGIETTAMGYSDGASTVYFDLNNDGFAERTGWVTGGDGLLAIDLNGNGKIDNQGELFGNGGIYADGFAALTALDSNADNRITSADAKWSKLRVWVDADGDGVTDSGELKTLGSLGITRIDLNDTPLTSAYSNENLVSSTATFVKSGVTRTIADVWFRNDAADTQYLGDVTLKEEVFYLPTLKGFGTLKPLHVAMSQDATLLGLVKDFVSDWTPARFLDTNALDADVQAILFRWAGVQGVAPDSRGEWGDARILSFLEKLTGQSYLSVTGDTNPTAFNQAHAVTTAYNEAFDAIKSQLIVQSGGYSLFSEAPIYNLVAGELVGGKISAASIAALQSQAASAPDKMGYWAGVAEFLINVKPSAEFDAVEVAALNAAIAATSSNAFTWQDAVSTASMYYEPMGTVIGSQFADNFRGTAQTDKFYTYGGDDILDGGAGADTLYGGTGNDTYVFAPGFVGAGNYDYLYEYINEGADTIKFTGVAASSIRSWHEGGAMYFTIAGDATNSLLKIYDTLDISSGVQVGQRIERIAFDNDAAWNFADGLEMTDTDDGHTLNGSALADTLDGRGGADFLRGWGGNDTLYGGAGDDTYIIDANNGLDTITDSSGSDTILFADSIVQSSIAYHRFGNNLVLSVYGTQVANVVGHFTGAGAIEAVKFWNGTTISLSTVTFSINGTSGNNTLNGTSTADTIYGHAGNDILNGLAGNDTLSGGAGNDTLRGELGNDTYIYDGGQDKIYETGGTDVLRLSAAMTVDALVLSDVGTVDTKMTFSTGNDITLYGQRGTNTALKVDTVQFADGFSANLASYKSWTWGSTAAQTTNGTANTDTILGRGGNDTINGNAGNDALHGGAGNDTVRGGDGNDIVHGGIGADSLYGDAGNDTLYGDDGLDNLWGGTGADSFMFLKGTAFKNVDVINDFNKTEADKINIADLLQGYDPVTKSITGFVQITTSGTDSILKVDADGGSNNFVQIATIKGVTGLTDEAGLVAGGYLIVA